MQKYNGKDSYDNRVEIDYNKQKVTFQPVKTGTTLKKTRKDLTISAAVTYLYAGIIIILAPMMIVYHTTTPTPGEQGRMIIVGGAAWLVTATIATITTRVRSRKKKWMKEIYPMFNALLIKVGTMGSNTRTIKIKPEQVDNKMVIIPDFGNIELRYKLYEDFTNIRRIVIKNTTRHNWYCIFHFNKKPKEGHMKITYT